MTYSIDKDGVRGRVFWTDLGAYKVSTVKLSTRYNDPVGGSLLSTIDRMFGTNGDYETAILAPDETIVVGSAATPSDAEVNHRRAVENLLEGTHLPEELPPLLRAMKEKA